MTDRTRITFTVYDKHIPQAIRALSGITNGIDHAVAAVENGEIFCDPADVHIVTGSLYGLVKVLQVHPHEKRVPSGGVAQVVDGYVSVLSSQTLQGVSCLVVSCVSAANFAALPVALLHSDKVHGKTGWNSDHCEAYYRTDANLAKVV